MRGQGGGQRVGGQRAGGQKVGGQVGVGERERERARMLAGLRRINHLKISEDLRSLEK